MAKDYVQAIVAPGAWRIPPNPIWNLPPEGGELRFEIETTGYGWNLVKSIRGVAATLGGKIYGPRNLIRPAESGYQMTGYVSIGGKKKKAFTGSQLFERPDGSLIDVAVLWIVTKR